MAVSAPGLPARKAALRALDAVLDRDLPLDSAWQVGKMDTLSSRDRGFARILVLSALRRLGSVDAVIDRFVKKRPVGKNRLGVQILRLAATELLVLDGAPHAAVDCAVRMANGNNETRRLSGMINAVCRKIADQGCSLFDDLDQDQLDTPAWLWEKLKSDYGEPTARAIAVSHRNGALLDLTLRDGDRDEWAQKLKGQVTPTGSLRLPRDGAVEALEGFSDGAWWVQDAAAALPVKMLGDVKGCRVLDLCAAPGGKTMQLAALGAEVTALDLSKNRTKRVRENLSRTQLNAEVVVADALEWEPEKPFEMILLDAPCSATGTIRRHPDLPHLKTGDEVESLTILQDVLMRRAWPWLAPGGMFVFATCSLLRAEGEDRIAAFLDEHQDAELKPLSADEDAIPEELIEDGMLRCLPSYWPEIGGMDGFFAARLIRGV